MGPILSMVQLKPIAPYRLTLPYVGRSPVTPQRDEGETIEPSVSVPIEKPTRPADVAAAGPADEPLEPVCASSGAHGLRVTPPNHLAPCASAPIDDCRVVVDHLIAIRLSAPGRLDSFGGKQIFRAPGNSVQGPTILSALYFG